MLDLLTKETIGRVSLTKNIEGVVLRIGRDKAERRMNYMCNRSDLMTGAVADELIETRVIMDVFENLILQRGEVLFVLQDDGILVTTKDDEYYDAFFDDGKDMTLEATWWAMVEPIRWFLTLPEEDLLAWC